MKSAIVLVVMAAVVSGVFGGRLFSEKENAKEAVNEKYDKDIKIFGEKLGAGINTEMTKTDENALNLAKTTVENKITEITGKLEKDADDTTRTAIAKGKPIQAVECIASVSTEGKTMIEETKKNSAAALDNVLINKRKSLEFLKFQLTLITKGLKELKDQAIRELDKAEKNFEKLKADAFRKFDSGMSQLHAIESKVTKPLLSDEYNTLRKQIENKCKEMSDILLKKLQKCIA